MNNTVYIVVQSKLELFGGRAGARQKNDCEGGVHLRQGAARRRRRPDSSGPSGRRNIKGEKITRHGWEDQFVVDWKGGCWRVDIAINIFAAGSWLVPTACVPDEGREAWC